MEYKFTSENFEEEVLKSDKPVLVDFYADWCGPCKMMAPVVAQLADELEGKAKVGKLNIDDCMDIAGKYRVMNIPTFLIIRNGQGWSGSSERSPRTNCRRRSSRPWAEYGAGGLPRPVNRKDNRFSFGRRVVFL